MGTYSGRDASETGSGNTEYELVDHEFENGTCMQIQRRQNIMPWSLVLGALFRSTYTSKKFRGDAIGVGRHHNRRLL